MLVDHHMCPHMPLYQLARPNLQAAREEEHKRARAEDAAARDAKYRAIVAEQEAVRARHEEEDALRWLLVEEEAEKRRAEAERKRHEDAERSRREMLAANEEQRR